MEAIKKEVLVLLSVFFAFLLVSPASAGISDFLSNIREGFTITGKATNPVTINITVGGPQIVTVYNNSMTDVSGGLNSGPTSTTVIVNFTAYTPSGVGNLNHSTATVNFSKSGEDVRNVACSNYEAGGDYANYSCDVTMWWWDGAGTWDITAYIQDNQTNVAQNTTTTFSVGLTIGFELSPNSLSWLGISPGSTNQTSNNDPLVLNNTGNQAIGLTSGNITVNATNLRGEQDDTLALWAGNFSIGVTTGAANPECGLTSSSVMNGGIFTNITGAILSADNYTVNDGSTGQEQLYFCLVVAGSELTTQSYSTANESTWTVQIE